MFNIRNINELKMMARIGIYSLIHSHTYDKKSVLYPFVNFKTLMNILITGHRDIASFEIIKDLYGSDDGESLLFQDVRIPIPKDEQAIIHGFLIEIGDIIIPYICNNDMSIIHGITNEGPYEINRHVRLKPSDIVIDAGANLGLFSAVACAKGCEVYAFEPVPSIIETYLNKTVLWNPPPPPVKADGMDQLKSLRMLYRTERRNWRLMLVIITLVLLIEAILIIQRYSAKGMTRLRLMQFH